MIVYFHIDFKPFFLAEKRGFGRNRDETDEFDQTIENMVGDFVENPDKRRENIGLFAPLSNDTPAPSKL